MLSKNTEFQGSLDFLNFKENDEFITKFYFINGILDSFYLSVNL